ncbi:MAG: hypothetical protein Q9160_005343 [Pyrenula sp. 1 TL-2023]
MPSSRAIQTAKRYISIFDDLSVSTFSSLISPSYTHTFAPSSPLKDFLPNAEPFSREGILAHMSHLKEVMAGFPVTAKEIVYSEESNCVVVWAGSRAVWREELMDEVEGGWDYEGEYVFMLWTDEKGEKVEKTVEFVDSMGTVGRFRELAGRARGNLERIRRGMGE